MARSSAAVPAAWLAKLKVNVSQVLTIVVVASVSTEMVGSAWSSTLSRTLMPACGEYTFTVIDLAVAANGIAVANPRVPSAVSVVPAQTSAIALFTTLATLLVPPAGSTTIVASSAPPKPSRP